VLHTGIYLFFGASVLFLQYLDTEFLVLRTDSVQRALVSGCPVLYDGTEIGNPLHYVKRQALVYIS
jgi:hypothetical protein